MEVHRPKGQIHSVKDFLIELATIVMGVVIALSFEGLREWNQHRVLANEARATIRLELADNKKGIDADLRGLDARKKRLDIALQIADDVLKSGKTQITKFELGVNAADLSLSGWQTAERTGALAHMPYSEVQKYAAAYALQDLYQTQERHSLEHMNDALSAIALGDPEKMPRADLERLRLQVLTMIADLFAEQQLGQQLSARYDAVLTKPRE